MNSASYSSAISARSTRENKPTRRQDIMRSGLLFLCRECGEMRRVKDYDDETGMIELSCGHQRRASL
jgi:hypothetical protein